MTKKYQVDNVINDNQFELIINFIDQARQNVYSYVNATLIDLYWKIGKHINENIPKHDWGKKLIEDLSNSIQKRFSGINDFLHPT